jgi:predicted helicase
LTKPIEDGLADTITWGEMVERNKALTIPHGTSPDHPFVQILDPATGTGTFLVEAIDIIHKTMEGRWKKQGHMPLEFQNLWNKYVPEHLLPRLHGFELMMAPYAIAHMKVGLKLFETGYRFDSNARAQVYLTNSLEPAGGDSKQMSFSEWVPALANEAQAVNGVKRRKHFTVVIGNPPYSVKSYNNSPWIRGLLEDFKRNLNETKLNLDDDFIKFLRFGTYQIESAGIGVLAMITNNIFLSAVTHRQVRCYLLDSFHTCTITNLHGDSRYGEKAPLGCKNENVFDIQQGVCVSQFTRQPGSVLRIIHYADIWGTRQEKSTQLITPGAVRNMKLDPLPPLYYFHPVVNETTGEYQAWPLLTEWMPQFSNGIETHKDGLTIHFTRGELKGTVEQLLSLSVEKARALLGVGEDGRDWQLSSAIKSLRAMVKRGESETAITYRPFDVRYTILNHESGGFIAYPRWEVMKSLLCVPGNVGLVSARLMARGGTWDSCLVTRYPTEKKTGDSTRSSTLFPLFALSNGALGFEGVTANLSQQFLNQTETIHEKSIAALASTDAPAHALFRYIYALLHSPSYRSRYLEELKSDFPRIPLTIDVELFRNLMRYGGDLVGLHLLESPDLSKPLSVYDGRRNPIVERPIYAHKTVWLDKEQTCGFKGVPEDVWEFHIGGYQVCEKWLKDRKGRTLSKDDITHYNKIVVALSETIRLMKKIDEVIDEHGGWPGAFVTGEQAASKKS